MDKSTLSKIVKSAQLKIKLAAIQCINRRRLTSFQHTATSKFTSPRRSLLLQLGGVFYGVLHFGDVSLYLSWGLCCYYLDVHRSLLEGLSSSETNNSFVYGWEMIIDHRG